MYQASDEVVVNTVTAYQQKAPSIAAGLDGTLLVAWQDYRFAYDTNGQPTNREWDITSQLLHPDLTPFGAEIVVTQSEKDQTAPRVVALPTGGFALAYLDANPPQPDGLAVVGGPVQDQANDGVALATLSAIIEDGHSFYAAGWVPAGTDGANQSGYADLPGYHYNVAHVDQLSDLDVTPSGTPWATWQSDNYSVNVPFAQVQRAVAINVGGTVLGDFGEVYGSSYGPGGSGGPFPVIGYSAALPNGDMATLVQVESQSTFIDQVRLELSSNLGAHSGQFVAQAAFGSYAEGALTLTNGNLVVLWNDRTDAAHTTLMARVYAPNGTPLAAAVALETGAGTWNVLDAIPLSTGGFAVGFIAPQHWDDVGGNTYVAAFDANAQMVKAPLGLIATRYGGAQQVFTQHLSLTESKQGFVYAAYDADFGFDVANQPSNLNIGVIKLGGLVPQPATDVTFADGTHLMALAENTANGTLVSTLKPVDVNLDDTFTYAFGTDANGMPADGGGAFALDAAGHLTVKDSLALDFEAPVNSFVVKVVATNQAGQASPVESLTVQLTDVVSETVFGDARDNNIYGNLGNDSLYGGDGKDRLVGGVGNDSLEGDRFGGPAGNDSLIGGDGNDTLVSLGGADSLDGGAGDDLAVINRSNYAPGFVLQLNDLSLTIASDGTKVIGVETFRFTGGTGSDFFVALGGNDTLVGGSGNDQLSGGGGDDCLDGGTGADKLTGGAGNDLFLVDSPLDKVFEGLNEGDDTVKADGNFTLGSGQQVEHLLATGITVGVVLKGNEFGQEILGSIGNDQLFGGGGDDRLDGNGGVDKLFGGTGNDLFHVHSALDKVFEAVGEGNNDVVLADHNFTLAAGQEVEGLSATNVQFGVVLKGNEFGNNILGSGGNDQLFGGAGNDALVGNAGNDLLDGGTGADFMAGGFGNDTYVVDDIGDQVVEQPGEGIDTVKVGFTYTLAPYSLVSEVENLTLTGVAAADGYGNDLDNKITGNAADNLLFGGFGTDKLIGGDGNDTLVGGQGNDVLTGGAGADVFRFNSPTEGRDVIMDFQQGPGMDLLEFSAGNGGAYGVGFNNLSAGEDVFGSGHLRYNAAVGLEQQFVYFMATGVLAWDANGQLAGGLTQLLVLSSKPPLQGSDFHIVG